MKKYFISLAIFVTSLFTISSFANAAPSNPYVSTSYGYQLDLKNTKKHQQQEYGYSQDDHGFVTGTIGAYLTPNTKVQLEYSKMKANGNIGATETTQQNINVVGILPIGRLFNTLDVYTLAGAGYTSLETENIKGKEESATAILGTGIEYQFNPTVSLISEVRTNYDVNINTWTPSATVGFKFDINGVVNSALGR